MRVLGDLGGCALTASSRQRSFLWSVGQDQGGQPWPKDREVTDAGSLLQELQGRRGQRRGTRSSDVDAGVMRGMQT